MSDVEYREIARLPNYRFGDDGSAWSRRAGEWKRLKGEVTARGYLRIEISENGKCVNRRVHRFILEAFVGPCPEGMEACHNDGNPRNNALENLRWDTHSANILDAVKHGTMGRGGRGGGRAGRSFAITIPDSDVVLIRKMRESGMTYGTLLKQFPISKASMSRICNGKQRPQAAASA